MTVYYVDVTSGDNSDTGLTEGLAWKDLGYAANQVSADDKVWVKASASYTADDPDTATCNWEVDTAGAVTTPIVWEGYTSSTGDGGVVTVDADSGTNVNPLVINIAAFGYNVFKNFRFTGGSGDGVSCTTSDGNVFKNCRFDNNDDHGFNGSGANSTLFYNCLFDSNGDRGVYISEGIIVCCVAHSNGDHGIYTGDGTVSMCLSYENGVSGDYQIYLNTGSYGSASVIGCTVDGDDSTTNGVNGIFITGNSQPVAIVNTIAFDCNVGIYANNDCGEGCVADAILMYSNDTDRTNFLTGDNDVSGTGDPFTDSGNNDYSLGSGSEAIDAGRDAGDAVDDWGL